MIENPWGEICKRIRKVNNWNQMRLGYEIYGNDSAQKLVSLIETGSIQPDENVRKKIWYLMQDLGQKATFQGRRPEAHIELYMRQTDPRSACDFIMFAVTDPGFRETLTNCFVFLIEDAYANVPYYLGFVLESGGVHYVIDTARIHFNHKDDFGGLTRIANNRSYEAISLLDEISKRMPGATFIEEIVNGATSDFSNEINFPMVIRSEKKKPLTGFDQVRTFLKTKRPNAAV